MSNIIQHHQRCHHKIHLSLQVKVEFFYSVLLLHKQLDFTMRLTILARAFPSCQLKFWQSKLSTLNLDL